MTLKREIKTSQARKKQENSSQQTFTARNDKDGSLDRKNISDRNLDLYTHTKMLVKIKVNMKFIFLILITVRDNWLKKK